MTCAIDAAARLRSGTSLTSRASPALPGVNGLIGDLKRRRRRVAAWSSDQVTALRHAATPPVWRSARHRAATCRSSHGPGTRRARLGNMAALQCRCESRPVPWLSIVHRATENTSPVLRRPRPAGVGVVEALTPLRWWSSDTRRRRWWAATTGLLDTPGRVVPQRRPSAARYAPTCLWAPEATKKWEILPRCAIRWRRGDVMATAAPAPSPTAPGSCGTLRPPDHHHLCAASRSTPSEWMT